MRYWIAEVRALVDPDEARRAADDILARPEYREPQPSIVDRVLEAIGDFLGRTLATLSGGGAGSVIGTVVVVALLALAAWLLARALGASWTGAAADPVATVRQATRGPEDPATWIAEADRLEAAGDLRGALRCRYQATVAALVRAGAADDVPGRTPAELGAELAVRWPGLATDLGEVTDRFERTWYGGEAVDAATHADFRARLDRIEAGARRPVLVSG